MGTQGEEGDAPRDVARGFAAHGPYSAAPEPARE